MFKSGQIAPWSIVKKKKCDFSADDDSNIWNSI